MSAKAAGFFMHMAGRTKYRRYLNTMFELRRFGIKMGLGTIRKILGGLGHPQKSYRCIHIAGSNGKGSVASTIAAILIKQGYKTGLYTSPHLVHFNERIRVNHRPISNARVVAGYEAIEKIRPGRRNPTFFEFTTAMALYEFGRQKVDWAVIETGMGGRLDATNIVRPALSIVTNISVEHREYLGHTIEEIAGEKAGIIKKGIPVVTGVRQQKARKVIDDKASELSAPLFRFGRDFKVRRNPSGTFNYYGIDSVWRNLRNNLAGRYQVENSALALAACEVLHRRHVNLSTQNIEAGLADIKWPGRLETVCRKPLILLDGAHNLIAARNLAGYLREHFKRDQLTLVVGILDDKPYRPMLNTLLDTCSRIILTRPIINRALSTETLYGIAKDRIKNIKQIPRVEAAVADAVKNATPDDVICIAGSLYVVGEAKQALEKMKLTPSI
jgi:dihydrofolate synthase/folylpolyglutamate synthase